ncbi:hypothetical protein AAF712_015230 [Marasmius tenuissimus]|uniref:Cytochrome P450 n=1 Tax=Marasmius tenuissimus TaxID=585030 RepID=A0ABR2Z9Y8_9AGAR
MSAVLGVGVFNTDGETWKFYRQMTRPFFTRDRISHFELFDKHAERAIQTMKSRLREGTALDFQDLMGKFTIDSATEFLFGSCVNNLSSPLPYPPVAASRFDFTPTNPFPTPMTQADLFAKAFLQAQEAIANREAFGALWPIFEILGDKKRARGIRKEKADLQNEVGEDETLLDHLVDITDDPVVLKDATLNILIAGRDTTAATLTFIMYFLATHPEVTTRLRNEVLDTVGTSAEGREISWEMIKEMKYLRAVINGEFHEVLDRPLLSSLPTMVSPYRHSSVVSGSSLQRAG